MSSTLAFSYTIYPMSELFAVLTKDMILLKKIP